MNNYIHKDTITECCLVINFVSKFRSEVVGVRNLSPCHEFVSRKSVEPLSTQYREGVFFPVLPRRDQRSHQKQTSNRYWGLVFVLFYETIGSQCHESVPRKSAEPLSTQYRSGVSYSVLPRRDQRGHQNQTSNRYWGLVLVSFYETDTWLCSFSIFFFLHYVVVFL